MQEKENEEKISDEEAVKLAENVFKDFRLFLKNLEQVFSEKDEATTSKV
jgi:hypothetical protein